MTNDSPVPAGSLPGSSSPLWQASVGWKIALLVTVICAGSYWLLNKRLLPATAAAQHQNDAVPAGMSRQIALADQNCGTGGPLRVPLAPPPAIAAQVLGFIPSATVTVMIARAEQATNGKIDPAYVHSVRALLHPDHAPAIARMPAIVPAGVTVQVGESVKMVGGHASPNLACHYVPNLIVAAGPQGG